MNRVRAWFYKKHWLSNKTVFDWEKVAAVFIITFSVALLVGMYIALKDAFVDFAIAVQRQNATKVRCLSAGYSDWDWAGGQYYCTRLVDGTEQVVPIERVE